MIIRSKAPLRISFAGGCTKVEPYLSERGGVVLSTAPSEFKVRCDEGRVVGELHWRIT